MPIHESLLVHRRLADFVGSGNVAVADWGGSQFVDNNVFMELKYFALRPGAHHKVSFRAIPGSGLQVRARCEAWLSLDVLNAPRVSISENPGPVLAPETLHARIPDDGTERGEHEALATSHTARLLRTTFAPPSGNNALEGEPDTVAMRIRPDRPILGADVFAPVEPSLPKALPIDVIVKIRDGPEITRQRLLGSDDHLGAPSFETEAIDGNEIVDVEFVNPNDVPVICIPCSVSVRRKARTNVVRMPTEMFTRVFNDALASLTPTVIIDAGKARATFKGDVAKHLGLHSLEADLPGSWEMGGATFEPGELDIMSAEDLFGEVLEFFLADLDGAMSGLFVNTNFSDEQIVELEAAYFRLRPNFAEKVEEFLDFRPHSSEHRARFKRSFEDLKERYPLLMDGENHDRADVGLSTSYKITRTHGSLGPIAIELDVVEAHAHLLIRQTHRKIPAPHGDLPRDMFTIGAVMPLLNFRLEIGDLDIDLDVPPWLVFVTQGLATLGAFLVEQGGEALFDYLADKAEREVPIAVHKMFQDRALEIGDLIVEAFETVANRDQSFHKAAASRTELAIATINRDQLKVPHDPNWDNTPSPTAEIEVQVPPVDPIDHDNNPIGPQPLVAVPPEARLNEIKHFIFVMMENRSFDHMLGYLSHPQFGDRTDVDGLERVQPPGPEIVVAGAIQKSRVLGGDLEGTIATPLPGPNPQFRPNLPHEHLSIMRQINNGEMNGFASEYARKLERTATVNPEGFLNDPERALRFQTKDIIETYHDLTENYLVCDRWFSAVPAGTYPNRSCYYSGVTPALDNDTIMDDAGYIDHLTLFDVLDRVNVDWKVFESDVTFLRTFRRFRLETERIRPITEFGTDTLPAVSFVDPNFTGMPNKKPNNDDQPPTDVRRGQAFVADIINKAKARPEWNETMIVVTYDEHGGFADHVPPPGAPNSSHPNGAEDISLAHPDVEMFGVRVPTFVVSPRVAPRSVAHQIFDHATVFKTLLQRFAPNFVNSQIIPERVRRARHLGEVLLEQPRAIVADVKSPEQPVAVAFAASRPVARLDFVEPEDREDMTAMLKQLGKPSASRRDRFNS
ncbi:alkaline phosphatase family protein [Loktanella sp. Alg231-35]|uniref:alkaline phosphatase family protein n=1 Tax=Loktanella sp. Alg231-35 TaxID=1922220 RepID=UPI000D55F486|nr:alkaline phosphatase family protein [Loktanella sp. Alg231-35]